MIKMLNMDCMEYMRTVPDKYFDLAIVDPPYGIGAANMQLGKGVGTDSRIWDTKNWDCTAPESAYFDELQRISKAQIIWGANHYIDSIPFACNSPCWLIWDKMQEFSGASFEMAWTSFISPAKAFRMARCEAYVGTDKIHPTQKPVKLYEWLLQNYAKPEFKILDTHLGSGSSAIAAHYFGVAEFVGTELDADYYKACCERFENATAQEALF